MAPRAKTKISEPHLLRHRDVAILPVCHYRVEFAQLVRRAVERFKPDVVAVELPAALEHAVVQAVERLPFLSVVAYRPVAAEADGPRGYLLVEPADPIVEAVRFARERDIPVACVDANVFDYPERHDGLPDPYAVMRVGHRAYFEEAHAARFEREQATDVDAFRETMMAYRVQELGARYGRVLLVCGMAHAVRVLERVSAGESAPFGESAAGPAIDRAAVTLLNLHEDSSRELLAEWPYLSAAYERARTGRSSERPPADELPPPRIVSFASRRLVKNRKLSPKPRSTGPKLPLDRQRVLLGLLREASARYTEDTGDEVTRAEMRVLMKFLRNYTLMQGRLQPDFYQIAVAARGAVDDNFAYEVSEVGTHYPWQDRSGLLPTIRLRVEDLHESSRTIRFHRRLKTRRKHPVLVPVRERRRESYPGEWAHKTRGGICSYPPESIVMENFANHLRKRAKTLFSEECSRVEPFTTSLLDGIDIRETIRNLHEGKIYVREHQKVRGTASSVVIIFDEDRSSSKYPWQLTWIGEHDAESDIAFYSTDPNDLITGPGIRRAEYGGLLMVYPPRQLADVWSDPYYRAAQTKAEVLLMAAIDYSNERLVAYVAAKPPRSAMKSYAARFGKKIVYIPLGQLSPVTLKRLRVVHIVSGHATRKVAGDYIW
jgi:hypothetical protein